MSKSNSSEENKANGSAGANSSEQPKEVKRVEVICEGTLGHLLKKKGDVTDDPKYVALLDTERGRKLVKEVK